MPKILIIDDDAEGRLVLKRILQRADYEVVEAATGAEAIEVFNEEIRLVITDIIMPDMDGVEVISKLKHHSPAPKFIAVTGGGAYVEAKDALEWATTLGVDYTLLKPVGPKELLKVVAEALREE